MLTGELKTVSLCKLRPSDRFRLTEFGEIFSFEKKSGRTYLIKSEHTRMHTGHTRKVYRVESETGSAIEMLHNMYNATSTADPPGSDELETYQAWLERQLLARIEQIEQMEKVLAADLKALNLARGQVPKTIGEPRHFNRTWQLIEMALTKHKQLNP